MIYDAHDTLMHTWNGVERTYRIVHRIECTTRPEQAAKI